MRRKQILQMTIAALFVAIGILLPQVTSGIPSIGMMLLPMHLPVLLCGFLCGYKYGALSGILTPLLSSIIFGMPPLYAMAIAMCFELCAYGLIAGLMFKKTNVYVSLVSAMLGGRIIFGVAMLTLLGIKGDSYTFTAFLGGAFINAWPGILIQLVLIPVLVIALRKISAVKELN